MPTISNVRSSSGRVRVRIRRIIIYRHFSTYLALLVSLATSLQAQEALPTHDVSYEQWPNAQPEPVFSSQYDLLESPESIETAAPAASSPQLRAMWDNGPVLESDDGAYRFHIGGRLQFDNTWYQHSQNLPFQLEDGTAMRRARLRADGIINHDMDFVTEVNFANIQDVTNANTQTPIGSVGLTDFYLTFKNVPVLENVRVGHFKQPIGLEHRTSSNFLYYMERSSGHEAFLQPFMFATGVMAFDSYWDDRATAALSLTRVGKQTVNPFAFGTGSGEYAITGRLTGLPVYEEDGRRLLHLGIGYDYSGTDEDQFGAANRPLVRAGAGSQQIPDIIRTGTFFTTDPVQIMNVEVATVLNRLSLSAEYLLARGTNVFEQFSAGDFLGPRGNATYHGLYVEAGLFLNPADYRRYNKQQAVWDRQMFSDHRPVQLVCRYSYLDLASGTPVLTPTSGAQAGQEHDITAGVNWYYNPQVHFMVNYVYTNLAYIDGTSGVINGLGCRLHLDF